MTMTITEPQSAEAWAVLGTESRAALLACLSLSQLRAQARIVAEARELDTAQVLAVWASVGLVSLDRAQAARKEAA